MKESMTENEIIKRKIFLNRQLIEIKEAENVELLTQLKEIERLDDSLNVPSFTPEKATESISAQ